MRPDNWRAADAAAGGRLPLDGVRILALTQMGAGPYAALQLADFGAEIIKIEDPTSGGDSTRYVPPFAEAGESLFFEAMNRNNRSLTLNLRRPEARAIFHELVAVSDAVLSNLRGDQAGKLGLTYEHLGAINPRIVCCAMSGFGTWGPKAAEPAYDYLSQALGGLMSLTGEPGGPPTRAGLPIMDFTAGLNGAVALMIGLFHARATGRGLDAETSLLESGISLLSYLAAWSLNGGFRAERVAKSGHPTIVPCQNFRTADGWIVVMVVKEAWWPRFCGAIGRPEWANDPRFSSYTARLAHRGILLTELDTIFLERTTDAWLKEIRAIGIPCDRINSVEEALVEPQVIERDMIAEYDHPRFGRIRMIAPPIKLSGFPPRYNPGPALGADADTILREYLGKTPEQIAEYRAVGAI